MPSQTPTTDLKQVREFFSRPLCTKAAQPLRNGSSLELGIGDGTFNITKISGTLYVADGKPSQPDISFSVPVSSWDKITGATTQEIGQMGILITQLMVDSDLTRRVTSKVHVGVLQLVLRGYFGVLALGGVDFMRHLASHGLSNMGKVKEAVSRMRRGT